MTTAPPTTTTPTRLPRFQRVKQPPRMVLTERDQQILCMLYRFRVLTRAQVERLLFKPDHGQDHFTKTDKARKRLRLLYHHGYVDRIPMIVAPGAWAWCPVYRLARKGAELVAEHGTANPYYGQGDDERYRRTRVSPPLLHHRLAINDVRIAVTPAAEAQDWRVEEWLNDSELKSMHVKDAVPLTHATGYRLRKSVIPDAYFVLHLGNRRAHFFLELDRATMGLARWKRRVSAYGHYVQSGQYAERFKTHSLRILTVTTTARRTEHLRRTAAQIAVGERFWFTTLDEVLGHNVLMDSIWLKAIAGEERSILIV